MRTTEIRAEQAAGRQRLEALLLGVALLCSACDQQRPNKQVNAPPPGKAEETWRFWEAFNKAAASGTGIEVLKLKAWEGEVNASDMAAVFEDIVAGERERSGLITTLPVLHVDPDLAAYAIQFAKARDEAVNVLQAYVALARRQEESTSMPALGIGLFLNLMNHRSDQEDGILWRFWIKPDKQRRTCKR